MNWQGVLHLQILRFLFKRSISICLFAQEIIEENVSLKMYFWCISEGDPFTVILKVAEKYYLVLLNISDNNIRNRT